MIFQPCFFYFSFFSLVHALICLLAVTASFLYSPIGFKFVFSFGLLFDLLFLFPFFFSVSSLFLSSFECLHNHKKNTLMNYTIHKQNEHYYHGSD